MTLRAGMFTSFRGVIRDDSYPVYVCNHMHETSAEAVDCAKECMKVIRSTNILPPGWQTHNE